MIVAVRSVSVIISMAVPAPTASVTLVLASALLVVIFYMRTVEESLYDQFYKWWISFSPLFFHENYHNVVLN